MKRTLLLTSALLACFIYNFPANADTTLQLREPQGRIGTYFKPEKYTPITQTNMSKTELENLHKNYKNEQKVIDKQKNEIQKQETQKTEQTTSKQIKKEDLSQKDLQRKMLAEKKKSDALKKQDTKEKLAIQQKENKAKLELQKQEEKRLKAEEEKKIKPEEKAILSHQKENTENNDGKFSFKLGKKQKHEVPPQAEPQNIQETQETQQPQTTVITTNSAQDKDTTNIVTEIKNELTNDRPKMLEELSTLWVSAVQKSDTVYFAIMKLSNPNGEEVNKNGFKKILEPIIGAAPLVGQAFVNPALTAGSIIGSNVMGTMMNDSAKTRLTKVNDADLVILARAIDELQETLLMNYMAYKGAKEEYELAIKIANERQKEYEELNQKNSPNTLLANTFYTEALDNQYKARQDFLMKRVVLEQMVGSDALIEIETGVKKEQPAEEIQQEKTPAPKEKKHLFWKKSKQN